MEKEKSFDGKSDTEIQNKRNQNKSFEEKRKQLVHYLKDIEAIQSKEIENAFLKVKREMFVPSSLHEKAYADEALPIGFGQTISQPSTIAIMLEMLAPKSGMKVGEIGSGCGYASALLGEIVGKTSQVIGTEIVKELFEASKKNLENAKIENVKIFAGDGVKILAEHGSFDRILVSAACPFIPKELFDCLNEGGKIVAPTGDQFSQSMTLLKKIKGKPFKEEYLKSQFVFVEMKGKHGFSRF